MKKILILLIGVQINSLADCPGQDLNLIPGVWLGSFSSNCGLQNAIDVNELKKVDDEDQNEFIEEKINKKIHLMTKQTFEEIASFEKMLWSMNIDLGKVNNGNVLSSCTLNKIAQIEKNCQNPKAKKRMEKLSKHFNAKEGTGSLKDRMLKDFSKIRSIDFKTNQEKSCPIPEGSASFVIKFQIDDNLLKDIKNDYSIEEFKARAPQFMHLSNEDLNEVFKKLKKAENILSKKKIINDFIKSEQYLNKVSEGLAKSCNKLFDQTFKNYICDDIDLYPNNKNNFEKLYSDELDNLSEDIAENKNNAVCRMEREFKRTGVKDYKGSQNSLDGLFNNVSNTRKESSKDEERNLHNELCSIYSCKSEEVKSSQSCINGGPVSKTDLETFCSKETKFQACNSLLAFVGNFEVEQRRIAESRTSSERKSDDPKEASAAGKKEAGMSVFLENFLGVEGSLAAEGKKITPVTIAEKKQEFLDKGIDPDPKSDSKTIMTAKSQDSRLDSDRANTNGSNQTAVRTDNSVDSNLGSQYQYQENLASTVAESQKRFFADKKGADKIERKIDPKVNPPIDLSGVRKEMEDMLAALKGSDREKMQTVADYNAQFMPKGSVPVVEGSRGLNNKEYERYEAYRKRLEEWESKLRAREFDLANRDLRSRSSASESDSTFAPKSEAQKTEHSSTDSSMRSGTNPGSALLSRSAEAGNNQATKNQKVIKGVDSSEAIVSSEDLKNLSLSQLKELGIAIDSSFIIKIKHQNKLYEVPVKSFQFKGKEILVPILSDKNKELSTIILVSPLFKSYKDFQEERAREREAFDKMIL